MPWCFNCGNFVEEKKIHALHGQLMSQVGTTSCQTVQLIISQHSRHYSGYQPRPRHSKHIIQKNIMIQAMPLSQQRRNLSFLIRHSGVNAQRLWWADFVVRGQRPAGCLRLGSVGRLHAAVSRLIHRHEGGIERFICQREKAGEKKCTLQSLDFCANCLVPATTCREVL